MSLVSLNIYLHLIYFLVQDCQWSDWGIWSKCTKECGSGGTQERKREKLQEKKDTRTEFGKKCYGKKIERQTCNEKPCISNPPSISDFESADSRSPSLDKRKGKWFFSKSSSKST